MVMQAVVRNLLAQDPGIESAVLPYVDDLLGNEDLASAERVTAHFVAFGLECKLLNCTVEGARLVGIHVQTLNGQLKWIRDNQLQHE